MLSLSFRMTSPFACKKREFYVKKTNPSNLNIVGADVGDVIFENKTKIHNAPSFCKLQ